MADTTKTRKTKSRILVAMSGGVDSSVTAALLKEAGHEIVGVTMKTFCYGENPGPTKTCCGLDGIMDARAVASKLDIPHHVFDVEEEFKRDVIDDFVNEYARGRTPNPCVRCNSNTKFRDLLKRGRALGCSGIATGHYVRIDRSSGLGPAILRRGKDANKDQAYFLWGLPFDMLPWLHFPLGDLTKPEVRDIARDRGLVTADKAESQEICFVPAGDYREFLSGQMRPRHPALAPGKIVGEDGRVLGEHAGYAGFTIGQRKGLNLSTAGERLFVTEIRPETREVVVGRKERLLTPGFELEDLNWLIDEEARKEIMCDSISVQIRHRAPAVPAALVTQPEPEMSSELPRVRFHTPQEAVTPGQSAAIFHGDVLVAGGRIGRRVS